jgi:hypothetical protein
MGSRYIWQFVLGHFCCKCNFNGVHIYHLKHFQDDLLDGPLKVKSASGSAAGSSLAVPSDSAGPSGSGTQRLPYFKDEIQKVIVETLDIPLHLTYRDKVSDLRVAYAKFLEIEKVVAKLSGMEKGGTWPYHRKPSHDDIIEVFMSRSGYRNRPKRFFPKVDLIPGMKQWLMNEGDAAPDAEVWGEKRPSYTSLEELLEVFDPSSGSKKKGKKAKRGKREEQIDSASSDEVVKGKGKGKAQPKPKVKAAKRGSSKKNGGSSKSRQDDV